jgi:hypothetical protein
VGGIVLFEGDPYAGATVRLWPGDVEGITDARGRFSLDEAPFYSREVIASAPGKRAAAASIPPGAERGRMELILGACDATVSGIVRDVAGGTIPRPSVRARDARGTTRGETIGDDDGTYSLCLPLGRLVLEVRASSYGNVAQTIDVAPEQRHDFILSPEAVIEGRIVDAWDGGPLPGAIASAAGDAVFPIPAVANESGTFRLVGLAPGRYLVHCQGADSHVDATQEVIASIEQPTRVECRLRRGRTIAGRIVAGDRPANDLIVVATATDGGGGSDRSDAAGAFSISKLPDGPLSLTLEAADILGQEPSPLPPTGDVTDILLRIGPRTSVTGKVTRDNRGVAGASVELRFQGYARQTITNAAGEFSMADIIPGRGVLRAESESIGARGEVELDVTRGEARRGIEIELTVAGSISGEVVDSDGQPVRGAFVRFHATGDEGGAVTSADGRFRVGALAGGRVYRAAVYTNRVAMLPLPAGANKPFPAVPVKDAATQVSGIQLVIHRRQGQIAGRVIDASGSPLADVVIGVTEPAQVRQWLHRKPAVHTVTDVDGYFLLSGLPAGRYAILARSPTGTLTVRPSVETGSEKISIIMPAETEIFGTLQGFARDVRVFATDGAGATYPGTVEGNRFEIHRVPSGAVTVVALEKGVGIPALDAITLPAPPALQSRVTLKARATYKVIGALMDVPQTSKAADCAVTLDGVTVFRVDVTQDGRLEADLPVGIDGHLSCQTGSLSGQYDLPEAAAAGSTVQVELGLR